MSKHGNCSVEGNLTEAAKLRHTLPTHGKSWPVIEFTLAVNAVKDGVDTIYHKCRIFVSEKHMQTIVGRMQDTKTRLKITGDQMLAVEKDAKGNPKAVSRIEARSVCVITLEKGKPPQYESIFSGISADSGEE